MMMSETGMGLHMIVMWVVVSTLVVGLIVIIWFLRRPPDGRLLERFDRKFSAAGFPNQSGASTQGYQAIQQPVEERLLIVIPDISGYTRFISKSRFALAHAHFVIQELLDAIMVSGTTRFTPMRIEGDAVVFRSNAADSPPRMVGDTIVKILEAFYRKRAQLKHDNICRCSICKNISDLDLKIIVHSGEVLRFQMGEFEDATGEAMIDAHRLMKGVSRSHRYILVSHAAFPNIDLATDWDWEDFTHESSGNDSIACHLALVPDKAVEQWDQAGGSSRSISDFVKKMASLRDVGLSNNNE